ncbi:hypothetical protein RDI58_014648 [Solanum bulbocastanum]|uniref:Uncharacterized protein n=1 Tax=Solanum bulbocastanum TaxID=147425 RepID=A0AAN8TCQ8_SOLBU
MDRCKRVGTVSLISSFEIEFMVADSETYVPLMMFECDGMVSKDYTFNRDWKLIIGSDNFFEVNLVGKKFKGIQQEYVGLIATYVPFMMFECDGWFSKITPSMGIGSLLLLVFVTYILIRLKLYGSDNFFEVNLVGKKFKGIQQEYGDMQSVVKNIKGRFTLQS